MNCSVAQAGQPEPIRRRKSWPLFVCFRGTESQRRRFTVAWTARLRGSNSVRPISP